MLIKAERDNPKIVLDDGAVVWGCECWWGPSHEVQKRLDSFRSQGYEIVDANINEIRKNFAEENA